MQKFWALLCETTSNQVNEVIKEVNKRMFFFHVQLKRANVPAKDLTQIVPSHHETRFLGDVRFLWRQNQVVEI